MEDTDLNWRSASYSSNGGGECVEVAETWRTASYSSNGGGNCVEAADHGHRVLVRDTKERAGAVLRFSPEAWRRFVDRVKAR